MRRWKGGTVYVTGIDGAMNSEDVALAIRYI